MKVWWKISVKISFGNRYVYNSLVASANYIIQQVGLSSKY